MKNQYYFQIDEKCESHNADFQQQLHQNFQERLKHLGNNAQKLNKFALEIVD